MTYDETFAGRGLRCDNQELLCDNEDYYCDGAVVMTEVDVQTEE